MNVITFDSLESTNNYCKVHHIELPHLSVIRARFQTAGRGQLQRQWQSNPNENILVSFLFKKLHPQTTVQKIEGATIQAIQSFLDGFGVQGDHKLPNDILVKQQKIAGMLIETKQIGHALDYVIVGVGININQRSFVGLPHATSLAQVIGKTYNIDDIFATFIKTCSAFNSL